MSNDFFTRSGGRPGPDDEFGRDFTSPALNLERREGQRQSRQAAEAEVTQWRQSWPDPPDIAKPFDLGGKVSLYEKNHPTDVAKVQSAAQQLGDMDLSISKGVTGIWGPTDHDGILGLQKRTGNKQDGKVFPNGPTIKTIKREVQERGLAPKPVQAEPAAPAGELSEKAKAFQREQRRAEAEQAGQPFAAAPKPAAKPQPLPAPRAAAPEQREEAPPAPAQPPMPAPAPQPAPEFPLPRMRRRNAGKEMARTEDQIRARQLPAPSSRTDGAAAGGEAPPAAPAKTATDDWAEPRPGQLSPRMREAAAEAEAYLDPVVMSDVEGRAPEVGRVIERLDRFRRILEGDIPGHAERRDADTLLFISGSDELREKLFLDAHRDLQGEVLRNVSPGLLKRINDNRVAAMADVKKQIAPGANPAPATAEPPSMDGEKTAKPENPIYDDPDFLALRRQRTLMEMGEMSPEETAARLRQQGLPDRLAEGFRNRSEKELAAAVYKNRYSVNQRKQMEDRIREHKRAASSAAASLADKQRHIRNRRAVDAGVDPRFQSGVPGEASEMNIYAKQPAGAREADKAALRRGAGEDQRRLAENEAARHNIPRDPHVAAAEAAESNREFFDNLRADPVSVAWNQVKDKFSGFENPRGAAVIAELEKYGADVRDRKSIADTFAKHGTDIRKGVEGRLTAKAAGMLFDAATGRIPGSAAKAATSLAPGAAKAVARALPEGKDRSPTETGTVDDPIRYNGDPDTLEHGKYYWANHLEGYVGLWVPPAPDDMPSRRTGYMKMIPKSRELPGFTKGKRRK